MGITRCRRQAVGIRKCRRPAVDVWKHRTISFQIIPAGSCISAFTGSYPHCMDWTGKILDRRKCTNLNHFPLLVRAQWTVRLSASAPTALHLHASCGDWILFRAALSTDATAEYPENDVPLLYHCVFVSASGRVLRVMVAV